MSAASRGARIASPASFTSSRSGEAVFKLISTTKSRLGAQRAVRYVARVRPGDRDEPGVETVQLRDGDGAVLTRARPGALFEENREAADAAFEALELTPEAENRTPAREDVNEAAEALGRAEARVREEFVPPGPAPPAAPEAAKMEAALVAHGVAEPDPALALHQALALALLDAERERERLKRARRRAGLAAESEEPGGAGEDVAEVEPGAGAAEDLRNRVAYHFAFSTPVRGHADRLAFELAVRNAVEENFTDAGQRCLWAVHGGDVAGEGESGHGHVHAHMIVKARNEDTGRQLQLGKRGDRDVRDLRESFAEHARAAGLTAEATWREDRAEVREGVAEGREVLRPHRDHGRRAGEPPWPSEPPRPQGLARVLPRRRRRKRPGPEQARLEARLAPLYADAGAAVETWRQLRSELGERGDKPSHADWLVANRPESFGDPLAPAFRANGRSALAGDKEIRRLLRGAAAEMPREMPPRPEGQLAAERRRLMRLFSSAHAAARPASSLTASASAGSSTAPATPRRLFTTTPRSRRRRPPARAAAWAEEKAGPVRRPARPAPAPVSRPAPAPGAEAPPVPRERDRGGR